MRRKQARKPLRERVADRKAGIEQVKDPKRDRILRGTRLFANLFQGIGLIMLMVLLGQYIGNGYGHMNWINVMIYSGMFLVGRAVISFMNLSNIMR